MVAGRRHLPNAETARDAARHRHGAAVSRHYLDPRRAGTSAEPDVAIVRTGFYGPNDAFPFESLTRSTRDRGFATESAALAAARTAAGFGHVAERACDSFVSCSPTSQTICRTCAWPRDAHR